jgi:Tol biopolymer transport system component
MRKLMMLTLFAAAVAAICVLPAAAQPRGTNGRIVVNADAANGQEQVYTLNPDGSDMRLLATDAEAGQWSPDGTWIAVNFEDGDHLVNPDNSNGATLPLPQLYPDMFLGCGVWSPDGATLACEGFGGAGDGVYTVRSSDGGDLQRVTSGADDDCPGDYSPNGKQLVFLRTFFDTRGIAGLLTVRTDGSGLRQIVNPVGMDLNFDCGSWSPQRNEILFSAHVPDGRYRSTVWVVHSDGSGMHEVPIAGCGGLADDPTTISCRYPAWSPDGQKIVFSRFSAATGQRDLYTVGADGSDLTQVTNTPGIDEFFSDWGTHPTTR